MGNRSGSNDGFNFRGGGYAQITGRDAYTLYFNYIKNKVSAKTIEELAALVHTTEELAIDSAFWFFCEFKNFEQLAIQDNFRELVRRWNGGFIGMPDREKYYQCCKQFL
jgi:putative chitinase